MSGWLMATLAETGVAVRQCPDDPDLIDLTDNTHHHSYCLHITRDEWTAFIAGVKGGEFDPDTLRLPYAEPGTEEEVAGG